MAKYIDADELLKQLSRKKPETGTIRYTEGFNDAVMRVRSMVHSAKGADVAPVLRGRWVHHANGNATCSRCGTRQKYVYDDDNEQHFCGCCGAKNA